MADGLLPGSTPDWHGTPFVTSHVYRHVSDFCLGKLCDFSSPLGFDVHVHCDRCASRFHQPRPETHNVSHEHGKVKLDAVHGHRDNRVIGPSGTPDLMMCSDRACLVDVTQQYAAENRPVRIRIAGHHHDFDRKESMIGLCVCQVSTSIVVFIDVCIVNARSVGIELRWGGLSVPVLHHP